MKTKETKNLWNKIIIGLKEKGITQEAIELWFSNLCVKEYKDKTLTLYVPNSFFIDKIEKDYKKAIQTVLNEEVDLKFEIKKFKKDISKPKQESIVKAAKPINNLVAKTTFTGIHKFKSDKELERRVTEAKEKVIELADIDKLIRMPSPYGLDKVACVTAFDSRYFTYPNDKRKKATVEIDFKYENGQRDVFTLIRGVEAKGDKGNGQLNTTHGKILLAIVHMWQEQGCQCAGKDFAIAHIEIKKLSKLLGYKQYGGANERWLRQQINDISTIPNLLIKDKPFFSFSFFSKLGTAGKVGDSNKTIVSLQFHPFISRQLYERKAILRNPDCYKIKNPTAFKFLIRYDSKIFMGNEIKVSVTDLAADLQMSVAQGNHLKVIRSMIKELNGFKINDDFTISLELIKENKVFYIIAKREAI